MNGQDPNNEPLSRVLREWRVKASRTPRFQEEVWRRIARSEAGGERVWWKVCWRWIESGVRRPALAVSYVAILMLVGLSAGLVQARKDAARMDEALGARYLQSVDPYQAPRH